LRCIGCSPATRCPEMEQYFGLGKGSETSVTSHNLAKLGQLIEGGIAGTLPSSHSGNIFLRRLFNVLFSKLPFAGSWNSGYYPKMPEPFPGPGWPAGLVAFLLAITASHIFEFLDSHLSSTSTSSRTSNHWILKDMTASNIFRWSFQLHNIDVCVKYGSEPNLSSARRNSAHFKSRANLANRSKRARYQRY
jgi:hypothetical protein